MKKMKLALVAMSPAMLFAEGTAPSMDTTAATTLLTSAQTGLSSLLTSAAPIIATVVLAGLAIWGGLALIRIVKRALRVGA